MSRQQKNFSVSAGEEREVIQSILTGLGARSEEAAIQADCYVEADLRGFHSHGVQRLPVLVERIRKGFIKLGGEPEFNWLAPTSLHVEGRRGLGPVVALKSLEEAEERAREMGMAGVAIRDSSHSVMAGYYCERWAERGWILIAMTVSEALVHPEGGAEALLGTNPIAMGFPLEPRPFVFDIATAASAFGKIQDLKHRGQRVPEGWAVDSEGRPTTDADAALQGSLNPAGGPKGYALGLGIELLVGLLAGTPFGTDVLGTLDTEHPCTKGDFFLLLNPRVYPFFPDRAEAAADFLRTVRDSQPAPGQERVRLPGDRSHNLRQTRLTDGIPLAESVWKSVLEIQRHVAK
jgi:LDH2 family malate/lactate/ureidoglycolate dehydrogenase